MEKDPLKFLAKTKKLRKFAIVILTKFNLEFHFETHFFVISMVDYFRNHTENGKKQEKILVT